MGEMQSTAVIAATPHPTTSTTSTNTEQHHHHHPPVSSPQKPTSMQPSAAKKAAPKPTRGKKRSATSPPAPPEAKRACVVGLKNLGNTCYNNAVIQALSHTTSLREYFLSRQAASPEVETSPEAEAASVVISRQCNRPRTRRAAKLEKELEAKPSDFNLCTEFSKLLRCMWGDGVNVRPRTRRIVSPHAFAGAVSALIPLFQERYEQQDAQEFLRCALEKMQSELIEDMVKSGDCRDRDLEDTIVNKVFGGVLWNKISCLACKEYTIKPDPFLDLSLVIPTPPPTKTKPTTKPEVTLEECMDLFSCPEELETLSSDESPTSRRCYNCGSEKGFTRGIKLGELPEVLCVHLKRFRWKQGRSAKGVKQKVDTLVRFPLEGLDLARWLGGDMASEAGNGNGEASSSDEGKGGGGGHRQQQQLYELYAVVVHQGAGVNSGHYSAFVKTNGDEWWSLNDERAVRATKEQVARSKAYLLFYRRQEEEV